MAVHAFPIRMLTLLSVDEILPSRNVKWSTNFRCFSFNEEIAPCLKHMNSIHVETVRRCVAIRFRFWWLHSDALFVCFGAKPTQRTEDEISRETGCGGGREGPREDRENQLTTVGRGGQSACDSYQENETLSRRGQEKMEARQRRELTEVRKATVKTCWPTEAGLTNVRRCQYC